jgi:hypothetical protein
MEPEAFLEAVAAAKGTAIGVAARLGIAPADLAAVAGAAALELIGECFGPAAAVEQLRTIADLAERELLAAMTPAGRA